ncbi:MAG: SPOR domain-containing protein, partial [Proteobacteria bacterium]|nr:SPOR domain-containing protein [Pseudomonadota bacterium]
AAEAAEAAKAALEPAPELQEPPEPAPPPAPDVASIRVQLGAFRSREAALAGWTVLERRHGALLSGLEPHIEDVSLAAGRFYRLQAGPVVTAAAAATLCRSLEAAGADCLVVGP